MATRYSYSGHAAPTTLSAGIGPTDMVITVVALTGYPDTTVGPFIVTLDRGQGSLEEKILVSSYSGTTVNVEQRGADDTTPQPHSLGAGFAHTLDAVNTIDSANGFVCANGTVVPAASAVGDSAVQGTSPAPAAADHKHARESFATGATSASAPGDTENDGTSVAPARADHKHAREAAPGNQVPIGGSFFWWSDTPPAASGSVVYLFLHGQTISGGATTYPLLAAVYPSWVSGSNLVLPDTRDKVPMGAGDTYDVAATGGAATVTLATGNIPQFSAVSVSITDPGHYHGVNDPGHHHTFGGGGSAPVIENLSSGVGLNSGGSYESAYSSPPYTDGALTGISTQVAGTSISGHVTFGSASPTAISVLQPFIARHEIVRAA